MKASLPRICLSSQQKKEALIDSIMQIYMAWYHEARSRWPNFAMHGRPADEDEFST